MCPAFCRAGRCRLSGIAECPRTFLQLEKGSVGTSLQDRFFERQPPGRAELVARVFFAVLPTVTAGEHRPAQSPRIAYPGGPVDTPRAVRPCFVGRRHAFLRLACGLAVLYPRARQLCRSVRSAAQKKTRLTLFKVSAVSRKFAAQDCIQSIRVTTAVCRTFRVPVAAHQMLHVCAPVASTRRRFFSFLNGNRQLLISIMTTATTPFLRQCLLHPCLYHLLQADASSPSSLRCELSQH